MKKSLFIILFVSTLFSTLYGQDTLYIHKSGKIIFKTLLSTVDSISFNHVNLSPVAAVDSIIIKSNSPFDINVLANDSDPENDPIRITQITNPSKGVAVLNLNGTITYTPQMGYSGLDSIFYTITDDDNGFAVAKVVINISNKQSYTVNTPKLWYLVGIDGTMNNTSSALGTSILPMGIKSGNYYDPNGNGEFVYTGYFKSSIGFKIVSNIGSWSNAWGMTNAKLALNGNENITVPNDGYYKIRLNSIDQTLSITPIDAISNGYYSISLIGNYNGWIKDSFLTPNANTQLHTWSATITFTENANMKFRADSNWIKTWGTGSTINEDPLYSAMGIATTYGPTILQLKGKYLVLFNDIDEVYYFFKQ